MQNMDYKTFINSVGNDLKIAIDDIIGMLEVLHDDVEKLKTLHQKTNKSAISDKK